MRNLGIFGNSVSSAPSSYSDVILADGPLGYWRLGESTGLTAVDISGNNLDGTYNSTYVTLGQPSLIPSDPDDKAILFKDTLSLQYSFIADPGADWASGGYSVEFVFKPATVTRQYQTLFFREGLSIFLLYNSLEVYFGQTGDIWMSSPIQTLTSYHVVVSAINGCSLFVNGNLEDYGSTSSFQSTGGISAGVTPQNKNTSYYGHMDELSVWDYALSQTQIQAHYAAMTAI